MGKRLGSLILVLTVVCFCFSSASFAEEVDLLKPVHIEKPEKINPENYHFLLEPVDTSKIIDLKGCIAYREKNYQNKQEADLYRTGTLKLRTNGLYRKKETQFPFTADFVAKVNFSQGKGPKKPKTWKEEVVCPMGGVEIRNFGTIGTMLSLTAGKESGDKDNTTVEVEAALYKNIRNIPVGLYTLYNKKFQDNEDFGRGRIDIDPLKFGNIRLGITGEGENWHKSKDGKSNSHHRIGAGPHVNIRIGETAKLDLRCIFQTSDQGAVTSFVGSISW